MTRFTGFTGMLFVILLALTFFDCARERKLTAQPQPIPAAIASPTLDPRIPVAWATPFPIPPYDPKSYIPPEQRGRTVTMASTNAEDEKTFADRLQAAQDDPGISRVIIGPGSLIHPVILRKRTIIDTTPNAPLKCDITQPLAQFARMLPLTDYGCMLVADGVHVSGNYKPPKQLIDFFKFGNGRRWETDVYFKALDSLTPEQIAGEGSTVLEPTFVSANKQPQVAVFQALGDVLESHTGKASDIAITGLVIKGRQTLYDGGVRSTVQLGNCHHCTVQDTFLWSTASIGITAGGSALEKNNFASDVLFARNIFTNVPAANMASINTEKLLAIHNYVRRPGDTTMRNAAGLRAGGGICGFDQETNSPADHTRNIYVVFNLIDFEGAFQESAGNGICMQDPYTGKNREEVVVANNWIIGGRGEYSDHRYMSNGIFLSGLIRPKIINNYVFRTGQNAIQAYNVVGGLIQDNDLEHTGGGGNSTGMFVGVRNTTVRRSHMRSKPGLRINAQGGWAETKGSCGNIFDRNMTNGVVLAQPPSPPCP